MKISIITVCYNSVKTIERTIQSVISQKCDDIEYIVIDGDSTDGTKEILGKYENYITTYISEPDDGIYDAMNKGISVSTGDIICFINSDDWYEDGIIKKVLRKFEDEQCDVVYGDTYVHEKNGERRYYDASPYSKKDMNVFMYAYHPSIFAKSDFFARKDNFDLKYKIAADYNWILGVYQKDVKISYIPLPIFNFSYGGVSTINAFECIYETEEIALKYCNQFDESLRTAIKEKCVDGLRHFLKVARWEKIAEGDINYLRAELESVMDSKKKYVICGAGERGKQCVEWLHMAEYNVVGIYDGDKSKSGSLLCGMRVQHYDAMNVKEDVSYIISSAKYRNSILREMEKHDISLEGKVLSMLDIEEMLAQKKYQNR